MELIHIGQPVLDLPGRLDYLLRMALNYPRLAEYQGAALDAHNKLAMARPACRREATWNQQECTPPLAMCWSGYSPPVRRAVRHLQQCLPRRQS
jgi:hypothetical protein